MALARVYDAYTLKVAGVVAFYMTAALVVSRSFTLGRPLAPNFTVDGLRVGISALSRRVCA